MNRLIQNDSSIITNIVQCDLWKNKMSKLLPGEIILPYYIFYNDLETGNCLGSHAGNNKFGAIYAALACVPLEIASKLSSILFCTLIYTNDKKESNNGDVFRVLIDEINFLRETGIIITIDGVARQIKFQLMLILGDNLGLNSILGFVESFSANHPCRICKMSRNELLRTVREIPHLLRNRLNYDVDCALKKTEMTGIKEPCIFNRAINYHVTENITVDMMHDVLEGVCLYTLKNILLFFIYTKKYFNLQTFNDLVKKFAFGPNESGNKPPKVTEKRLKDRDSQLSLSAAEILCLTRYLGLIIGEYVPKDTGGKPNEHWQLYQLLRRILDIVTNPRITRCDSKTLEQLVIDFNSLYIKLFGQLKPKFHFLTHYPSLLLKNGPFTAYWTMRYESKHRDIKSSAQSTSSAKNVSQTVAKKQLYKMTYMFQSLHTNKM